MSELPDRWTDAPLEKLCSPSAPLCYGVVQPGNEDPEGIPLVRVCDLADGTVLSGQLRRITPAVANTYRRSSLQGGELLVSLVGTVGRTAIVPPDLAGANIARAIARLTVPDETTAAWVHYCLNTRTMQHALIGDAREVARKTLNLAQLRRAHVPLPPLNEQRRIVSKIDALTARSRRAKEALDAVPALLDKLRQSILAAAFRGDLTADWRAKNPNVEPASALLERIHKERRGRWEETELAKLKAKGKSPQNDNWKSKYKEPEPTDTEILPKLPAGWAWATVETVGEVDLGRMRSPEHHTGNNEKPYLRVKNVFEDRIDVNDVMTMHFTPEEFEYYKLRYGDVLLNEGQSHELVGRPAIFRDELPDVAFTNSLLRYRPFGGAPPEYALLAFRHYLHSGRFQRAAQITTNIAHLGAVRLRTMEFPVAPVAEQHELIRRVSEALARLDALVGKLQAAARRCADADAAILAKAFRGELVPQDPNDEPASVLLERIRAERETADAKPKQKRAAKKRNPAKTPTA